ncbi:hypothetical protein DFQ28_005274 [Apophysomyces sp. BC1034]|nr:hypothetical protein DFQ29_001965 [Apophysomyces sp. BC1021]KAG0193456.1 hypothetical protein DFQ28_005274 [Apophysomyces sp. BC1034]
MLNNDLLTTGDSGIDYIVGGGVSIGTVTEVVGESSSGKTQFALQLCLTVQKPVKLGGLGGSAVYLHSEGRFPAARLDQLTEAFCPKYGIDADSARQSIHTMPVLDSQMQYRVLAYHLPVLLERCRDVRLIVLDSISASYRSEQKQLQDNNKSRFERMEEICELGTKLKRLAHQYRVAVVVVNQVSDALSKPKTTDSNPLGLPPEHVAKWMDFHRDVPLSLFVHSLVKKPVLGLAWSNAVNIRIRLARSPMMDGAVTRRALFVDFSPAVPRRACEVVISKVGLQSCNLHSNSKGKRQKIDR